MHSSDRNLVKERRIYLKKLKKLFIITGVIFIILVLQFCVFYNSVMATQLDSANIYMVGDCGSLLKYKGVEVKVSYVQYTYEGVNYPAYCLDKVAPFTDHELASHETPIKAIKTISQLPPLTMPAASWTAGCQDIRIASRQMKTPKATARFK